MNQTQKKKKEKRVPDAANLDLGKLKANAAMAAGAKGHPARLAAAQVRVGQHLLPALHISVRTGSPEGYQGEASVGGGGVMKGRESVAPTNQ